MPTITVIQKDGSEKQIEAETGWSFMEILRDAGFEDIEGACGGSMACATCHMYIHPDWTDKVEALNNEKTEEEEDILDLAFHVHECSRLGCQIRMSKELDGIVVAIPGAKVKW
jgi:2Fe-2S ferredoxin